MMPLSTHLFSHWPIHYTSKAVMATLNLIKNICANWKVQQLSKIFAEQTFIKILKSFKV
jgi:hypothetical protein